jgi:hypothetical protein
VRRAARISGGISAQIAEKAALRAFSFLQRKEPAAGSAGGHLPLVLPATPGRGRRNR